jgi:hypothetical protein
LLFAADKAEAKGPMVWGIAGLRGYPSGEQVASNGVEFDPLFSLDLDSNLWLWRRQGLYLFVDSRFWGQKAAPGITNPSQGAFDFSKREFDLDMGGAWNYYGRWEGRVFAYSFNNINRGNSETRPSGFNDGVGFENRYYLGNAYDLLGTQEFDVAKAPFLSLGYYPTKDMIDANGDQFKPGPFARAYLTWDLFTECCYLYSDNQLIAKRSFPLKKFSTDSGIALRPFICIPRLEFRLGTEDMYDFGCHEWEFSWYGSIRYVF